mmetsp:Transcript_4750/g.13425  ORF Transcript_4750/g.13425 Transcript_4750/m.13425 type:complete len:131 (-) Transcript_4750:1051-1443(-)
MQVRTAKNNLHRFDMYQPYMLVTPDPLDPSKPLATRVDLLEDYTSVILDQVKASVRFFKEYAKDWYLEDINWTLEYFENSNEEDLATKVSEKLEDIDDMDMGGPTYTFLMLETITSTTEDAMRSLVVKVQ